MWSSKYKIMHIIWSLDLGGAEQVVLNLASRLDRDRFESVVCCLNEKGRYAHRVEELGVRVVALHKRPKFDPLLIPRLAFLIRKEKIDLVHTHLFTSNLWGRISARLAGVPVISTEHGMDIWRGKFCLAVDEFLTRFNRRVIFVSEGVQKFYTARNRSINGKGRVLHNGIDVKSFERQSGRKILLRSLGIPETKKIIGIVGRLVPEKAHADFIETIQLLREEGKDVLGLIVGEGDLEEKLRERVREAGLEDRVIFVGFRKDLQELYSAMDVFVICSLREGFPLTILEAMAAGVPVVATKVGGVVESIEDEKDGLLVPPGDTVALARSILRILQEADLRERLIRNAREKVRNRFSVEKMVKDHEALYEEVLAS